MQSRSNQEEIQQRNQLINDFLTAANGQEVHEKDIAYFLNLDPYYINHWLKKHKPNRWKNGKTRHWWKLSNTNNVPKNRPCIEDHADR